ncbi:MAG: helix-turn-helix domain-containing protein [Devosia sp.]
MPRRQPNPKLAKALFTYSVAEMAALYGCHRNTVRNWFRLGLQPIDDKRPAVVKGDALNAFHSARRLAGKRPCGPLEIYCAPCHKPQRPDGDMVEIEPINSKVWKVSGICPTCNRMLTQRVGAVRLAQFRALDGHTMTKPQVRIGDASAPSVNCDFTEKERAS